MKNFLLTLVITLIAAPGFAQDDDVPGKQIAHYIFDDFTTGIIKKKDGGQAKLPLNYNTLTEEMVFIRDTQRLAMTGLEQIDTVYVGGKIFVPVKNVFYEKATNTPVALYVEHKSVVMPPGSNVGYGMTSETSAVSDVSSVLGSIQVYKLHLPDGYKVVARTAFWVNSKGSYIQVTNLKKLTSLFPAKAQQIKDFAQANKLSLTRQDDMVKLVEFCNG